MPLADGGLAAVVQLLDGLDGVYVHEFEVQDVVRSALVRRILERYASA